MSEKDGGPAFPCIIDNKCESGVVYPTKYGGMSLRDYYAGEALSDSFGHLLLDAPNEAYVCLAIRCFKMADAMLLARKKEIEK